METTDTFSVNIVGEESGNTYTGTFKVKTLISRRDAFAADEKRRLVIGSNPMNALSVLDAEAFMIGQLMVRVLESPQWWKDSSGGLDMDDGNVTSEIFNCAIKAEQNRKDKLIEAGKAAKK